MFVHRRIRGRGRDLDPLLFVSQLNLRLLMMILNKGKIFSSRENYLSNIGTTTTSFLTKGSSPFRIFGKSKEFVPTGRMYGVLEHPKLKEICLFCCILQGIIHCSTLTGLLSPLYMFSPTQKVQLT